MLYLPHNRTLRTLLACFFGLLLVASIALSTVSPALAADVPASTKLGQTVGYMVLGFASFFTGVGGYILEVAVDKLVLGFGSLIRDGGMGSTINNLWILIRDICNLAFIFGFIYIGIKTIIDSENTATKRLLAQLIIAALLINFSLFFTKFIIDFGNLTAVEIYNQMGQGNSVSAKIADSLGITQFYTTRDYQDFSNVTNAGTISFFMMAALLLFIAAFVLAAGGILIIVRFVALIFIMIFSPVLFAATIFPQTKKYSDDLWRRLINYSFFPAAYLLLLFITIHVVDTGMKTFQTKPIGTVLQGPQQGGFEVVVNFIVVIMFLVFSLKLAHQIGMTGGSMAVSVGNNLRGRAQSWVGRTTVGLASEKMLKGYEKLNAKSQSVPAARWAGNVLKFGSLGVLGDRSIRGTLESGKKSKFGGSYSRAEDVSYEDEKKKRLATIREREAFERNFDEEGLSLLSTEQEALTPEQREKRIRLERAVADASTKYLEELKHDQRLAVVELMTQSQIEALNKSEKLTDVEKRELGEARARVFHEKYGIGVAGERGEKLRDNLSKANADHLIAMGMEFITKEDAAIRLTNSQMEDLKKKVTPTEYSRIDEARKEALRKLAEDGATIDGKTAQNHILKMKASDMSRLPPKVLIALAPSLPTSTLIEIAKQNTLNAEDQRSIRKGIEDTLDGVTAPGSDFKIKPEDKAQLEAVEEFLSNNPYGKQFGK